MIKIKFYKSIQKNNILLSKEHIFVDFVFSFKIGAMQEEINSLLHILLIKLILKFLLLHDIILSILIKIF